MISIWNKTTFAYVSGVELNFGYVYPHESGNLTRHLIPNSNMAGDKMYFYGSTLGMYGSTQSRFAFISMFDTVTWNHGCAYSQTIQSSDYNFAGYMHINGGSFATEDYGNLAITVTTNTRAMNTLDVATNVFTYPLNKNYLAVAEVNPCMNSFEDSVSKGVAWLDGTTFSFELDFPATRLFAVDTSTTCVEPDSDDLVVFNNNGEIIDCLTTPFSFCDGMLTF